jgi:hypothetical protein
LYSSRSQKPVPLVPVALHAIPVTVPVTVTVPVKVDHPVATTNAALVHSKAVLVTAVKAVNVTISCKAKSTSNKKGTDTLS